jgi:hypothetical protein
VKKKMKKEIKIGEKVGEWEMEGEGCLAFPLPPNLHIYSFNLILKGSFFLFLA